MTFKRGIDPKSAMGTGIAAELDAFIKEEYPNLAYRDPNQLLRICADHGKLNFVKYLIEKENADPHTSDEHCLRWAAKSGHLDVVKYLVEQHDADIKSDNYLAMRWALDEGHSDVFEYLKRLRYTHEIKESVSGFQRGLEPRQAMGTGKAALIPEIEQWLKNNTFQLKYTLNPDTTIDVLENLRFYYNKDIKELPEYINFNIVHGNFEFSNSVIKSLRGFPKIVKGDCSISRNRIKSLERAPEKVGGRFDCSYNRLTSLKFAPKKANEFSCEGNTGRFTFKDVLEHCDVASNIVTHTVNAERHYEEMKILAAKRKASVPVAQRTSHVIGVKHYPNFDYTDYTKGYKGYKIYEFIRDNGPVTAEQVGRFAHEMTYGKTHKGKDGTRIPYTRSEVTGHGMGYLNSQYSGQSPYVNLVKKGKFKYDDVYSLSPAGHALLQKKEHLFGTK